VEAINEQLKKKQIKKAKQKQLPCFRLFFFNESSSKIDQK